SSSLSGAPALWGCNPELEAPFFIQRPPMAVRAALGMLRLRDGTLNFFYLLRKLPLGLLGGVFSFPSQLTSHICPLGLELSFSLLLRRRQCASIRGSTLFVPWWSWEHSILSFWLDMPLKQSHGPSLGVKLEAFIKAAL
ncbi:MAG: hypothetical protein LBE27_04765, partial [Deltaproteobacteria bacterium]|nr:hypothetical protein [Deltaproteobacteria bacterium]